MFLFMCSSFPNNYWDKFVKRKVSYMDSFCSKGQPQSFFWERGVVCLALKITYVCNASRYWINMGTSTAERGLRSCSVWTWPLWTSAPWRMRRSMSQTPQCSAGLYCSFFTQAVKQVCITKCCNKQTCLPLCRITSIDIKYQIWKFGVVFTDNVSLGHCVV